MNLYQFLHSSKTQAIGFYIVLIGFPVLIAFGHLSEVMNNRLLDVLVLGSTFYWGSSKSGASKDATIANLASTQQAPVIDNSQSTIKTTL